VNRGPDSLEVLRYIKTLGSSAVTVLGNHDVFLLAAAAKLASLRPKDTLALVLDAPDREELMTWLRRQPLLHREGDFLLVHAGLLPQWSVEEAEQLAGEAAQGLRSADSDSLLQKLHPNDALQWKPDLHGLVRLAAAIKVLTRLRTCSEAGTMDTEFSGPPDLTPAGFYPWFQIPHRRSSTTTIVCGHWAALGLRIQPDLLALDSGCVYGRQLSAIRLEDRKLFQVQCRERGVDA
jgi:bis(5'-nucleosyl)-tetraphosphatase (symmetrical)